MIDERDPDRTARLECVVVHNDSSPASQWQPLSFGGPSVPASDSRRVGFVSLGCPKNLVDSEVMLGTLKRRGHQIATDIESADVPIPAKYLS